MDSREWTGHLARHVPLCVPPYPRGGAIVDELHEASAHMRNVALLLRSAVPKNPGPADHFDACAAEIDDAAQVIERRLG